MTIEELSALSERDFLSEIWDKSVLTAIDNQHTVPMTMKELFLQLREAAQATCSNAYLMNNGRILTNAEYKSLTFSEKLHLTMYYKYNTNQLVKI